MTAVKGDRAKISNPGAGLCAGRRVCPLVPVADPGRPVREQLAAQTQRKSPQMRGFRGGQTAKLLEPQSFK